MMVTKEELAEIWDRIQNVRAGHQLATSLSTDEALGMVREIWRLQEENQAIRAELQRCFQTTARLWFRIKGEDDDNGERIGAPV